ncbi:MAG: bacillithiol system redox-active protein YtxJ [Chitinophagaceae bacterium]|uniref:bacillithiol system redox-active protein YtxJ n=1 Tax=unclassified Paraflavitalea TaxID=2798305 RepID=UPI003D32EF99|nr:bacillithiol system redox-active protein YtxJ [Chitinophagaceae bacterium]
MAVNWIPLTTEAQLEDIKVKSTTKPQVIFKHSTRCSISSVAKSRLDQSTGPESIDFYYLDLLQYRNISNKVAELFAVHHESPQVILIKNGDCTYDESHMGIRMNEIVEEAK